MLRTLQEIWDELAERGMSSDKGDIHSYLPIYEEILAPYRSWASAKNILEIGLLKGDSLRMWDEYFNGDVYGIDCDIKPVGGMADLTQVIAEGFKVSIGDAANPNDIEKFYSGIKFDVVVEDANHNLETQLAIYKTIKPYLAKDALYIIEDIQSIDTDREIFENIDPEKSVTIIDRRSLLGRYDDVIVIIK